MDQRKWTSGWPLRLLALAVGVMVVLAGTLTAQAQTRPQPVTGWIRHHAAPLETVDPAAPLDDLAPLGRSIGDAEIVGLGESVHGAAEEETLKLRTLRFLVERMDFRSIAWEEDWTTGLQINEYIRTGKGDLDALMSQMSPQWQSRQVADVLRWLHDYNAGRADKVQFVGVEYYLLRPLAYDAVDAYVASTAPERLAELRRHLLAIRPSTSNMFEHIQWYLKVADKQPYIRHARQVYELVKGLPHRPGDRAYALTLHTARQIVSFYEHVRDWFERPFGKVGLDQFALDLRTPAPPPVRDWLQAPIKTRGLADRGPDSYMAGGTLAQWFDVIVHRQELTPTQPA